MADKIYQTLLSNFGHSTFRNHQEAIIKDVLDKKDVFVLMPTGSGKSLCFQVPALIQAGLTVVVSPLISLMKDQVDGLKQNGIKAEFLNSSLSFTKQENIIELLVAGKIKLLYIAPERLVQDEFLETLNKIDLSLFAIDESHCISQWGHDFRPEYRQLNILRQRFTNVPIITLTATATKRVKDDIISQIGLKNPSDYFTSFDRPNLKYSVIPKQNTFEQLMQILEKHKGESGIIYCFSRRQVDELAFDLQNNGLKALSYHAGMESEKRKENQEKFIRDDVNVIVATTAFGMGIDKPDVRFVIHYDLPQSLEGYYQETGRAGRDGLIAECILFFSYGDKAKIEYFINQKETEKEAEVALYQLNQMINYAESRVCRRKVLLKYFGETYENDNCGNCDNCLNPGKTFDATVISQKIISCVYKLGQRFGVNHVSKVLKGSRIKLIKKFGHDRISTFGLLKEMDIFEISFYVRELAQLGFLTITEGRYPIVKLSSLSASVLKNSQKVFLHEINEYRVDGKNSDNKSETMNLILFENLRALRKKIADKQSVPPYLVFPDTTLIEMAKFFPQDQQNLLKIKGVGSFKAARFGPEFLELIQTFCRDNGIEPKNIPRSARRLVRKRPKSSPTIDNSVFLFKKGNSIPQIAKIRGLSVGTITVHLANAYVAGADISLEGLVEKDKFKVIKRSFKKHGLEALSPIKNELGADFSYDELQIVRALLLKKSNKKN